MKAGILAPGAEYLAPMTFDSLDSLIAFSASNPKHFVAPEDDREHYYQAGAKHEMVKV